MPHKRITTVRFWPAIEHADLPPLDAIVEIESGDGTEPRITAVVQVAVGEIIHPERPQTMEPSVKKG